MKTIQIRDEFDADGFSYELDIQQFIEYLALTEKVIDKAVKSKQQNFESLAVPIDYKKLYSNDDDYIKFLEGKVYSNIKSLYYSSILISVCSLFETKLLELCRVAEKKSGITIENFTKKKKIYYSTCITYLTDCIKIKNDEPKSSYLNNIKNYIELRNFLIHNNNEFIQITSERAQIIDNSPFIYFISTYEKEINGKDYINYKIENASPIFDLLNNIGNFFYYLYYEEVEE